MPEIDRTQNLQELERQPEIQDALADSAGRGKDADAKITSSKNWLGIILAAAFGLAFFFGRSLMVYYQDRIDLPETALHLIVRTMTAGTIACTIIFFLKLADQFLVSRFKSRVTRYNLHRILVLVAVLLISITAISTLFLNWKAAFASVGIVSLILGFALQSPITSLVAWVYILIRRPFRVGDRIVIEGIHGDVIDLNYFDMTLWEFGGEYLSTDHPSGRIVKIPNSVVFDSPVLNYSWPLFPYIWNEIKFQVAYESDLEFVGKVMKEVAEEELGETMMKQVCVYRNLLERTPVDALEVRERPAVFFRISEFTWIDATVRYLVPPKEAGRIKSRMIEKMLEQLNAEPERVLFPKSNAR